jgi:hypothetical protein
MSTPIEGIGGPSDDDSRVDMIRAYMGLDNAVEAAPTEFSTSGRSEITSVVDSSPILEEITLDHIPSAEDVAISSDLPSGMKTVAATEDCGNLEPIKDSDKDGIPDYLDATPNGDDVSPATQALIDEMLSTDTDGDGILDFLDATGSETQIEQMYDKDFERKQENVRAFISLMSIFSNLDLTKFSKQFTEPGGDSLTTMVAAGVAQVALTHSARLQEPPPNITPKKEDIKNLIEQYKKQSDKNKLSNLRALDHFVEAMPATNPMKAMLQAARKPASAATK